MRRAVFVASLMRADGTIQDITPGNGQKFSLKELQTFVGGYIEIQRLPKTREMLVLNEEGKLIGLPRNAQASAIWQKNYPTAEYPIGNDGLIVGDVVICKRNLL
jgi:hypothetical protein